MQEYLLQLHEDVAQMCQRINDRIAPADIVRIEQAFHFAAEAHAPQRRKTGEPYIMHPVAVARIVAEEFMMDANSIIAAFLHDVVEDTEYTNEDIRQRFGDDVAFLVKVVTKPKGKQNDTSDDKKQENNFRQLLDSIRYDIRAVLVKLADRLHNMRTLGSMMPVKQMKIGAETDFFYAPFANRLGLNNLRRELENLSFKFRSKERYERLEALLAADREANADRLDAYTDRIKSILAMHGLNVRTEIRYRLPYSIDQRMREEGCDFEHVPHRYVIRIIYDRALLSPSDKNRNDKAICLRIYGALTNHFKEKTGSLINYVDNPKENGYQSLHVQLLGDLGTWEDVHISSEEMVRRTKLGLMLDSMENAHQEAGQQVHGNKLLEQDDRRWIGKFCDTLRQITENDGDLQYMEGVSASLYSEDITIYDKQGRAYPLPLHATALDFAFERGLGTQAQYARIDGRLASLKTELTHGVCVEIGTSSDAVPQPDWVDVVKSYKAKDYLRAYFRRTRGEMPNRCPHCAPLPGQEVIGIVDDHGTVEVHRRDCTRAISLSAQRGDSIVEVDFPPHASRTYTVRTHIRAIDRYHLVHDIIDCITNGLGISISYLHTEMADYIVECTLHYDVHSVEELRTAVRSLAAIPGVEDVYKI
ncbi:MAG: bifunctional (p)ppGpp synthetase/guanosine-3',5'-bis(diphosphate) 3'-pyrophosphohydrolase [Bacteroidaceae bacterium]|nr:bifunctional (p)ppGpp synthetase/guanosine-3',5'-bis(diphosphate) 3'-pyrophosphohydrolase [Bacteroidaceae bacterium]